MKNKQLQALRRLFFISASEAAEHIGGVKSRAWYRWETGEFNIPADVIQQMNEIAAKRLAMIETVEELMIEKGADAATFAYYMTFEEYKADHKDATFLDWRLSQSVAAYFYGDGLADVH